MKYVILFLIFTGNFWSNVSASNENKLYAASKFLRTSSLGADMETIQEVSRKGIVEWLDEQLLSSPKVNFTDTTWMIWNYFHPQYTKIYGEDFIVNHGDAVIPYWYYWKMAWWNNILKSDDHVRQRVTQALSQIFVISEKSNLQLSGPGMANYYDMLYKNSFGNFRELLHDVTLHPMMGFYLSHINNPKSNKEKNIHPDENYAREIMQLFSIGLLELNTDGTNKLDKNGKSVPTYDNADIKEFAKIFTGLGPSGYYWPWEDFSQQPVEWGSKYNENPSTVVSWKPMKAFNEWHEPGVKILLNGKIVPNGQTAIKDIEDAIDNLFYHPNVGPFIGKILIQRLVKSNPSSDYVRRVAEKFNDNGLGVRGDMRAVIRSILTDREALNSGDEDFVNSGKLREPLLKYTQALRAFNAHNESGKLWNWGCLFDEAISQGVLTSPSVFNFYLPKYQPNGPITKADLFAPEFQIHTSATSINYINLAYDWFIRDHYGEIATKAGNKSHNAPSYEGKDLDPKDYIKLDLDDEYKLAHNASALIDRLDLILTGGQLSNKTKSTIIESVEKVADPEKRVRIALFLAFISPDYSVQK